MRDLVDYVCEVWDQPDLSIWEVRGEKQNFLYSKIMCWVALDRGLRLADKRSLPAPNRDKWLANRDRLYDEIEQRGYNKELGHFGQSYERNDVLDAAVLIAPLVFFTTANDPRFQGTLNALMRPKDRGGLFENNLVYRYDTDKVDDGTGGGEEGRCVLFLLPTLGSDGADSPSPAASPCASLPYLSFFFLVQSVKLLTRLASVRAGAPSGSSRRSLAPANSTLRSSRRPSPSSRTSSVRPGRLHCASPALRFATDADPPPRSQATRTTSASSARRSPRVRLSISPLPRRL